MRLSKNKLPNTTSKQLYDTLCKVLADTRTPAEADSVLSELLSPTEIIAIMKRIGIAASLSNHQTYDSIKTQLKVSSATIAVIQERLIQPGWQRILDKVKLHQAADIWSQKIKQILWYNSHK